MCKIACSSVTDVPDCEAALGQTIFDAQENALVHNPYAHEQRKLTCI